MTEEPDENQEEQADPKKEIDRTDDRLKKGIAIGSLAAGLYFMDRMLAEEKTVVLKNNQQIKIRKGILDEFFE